jgi:hypothetical protein
MIELRDRLARNRRVVKRGIAMNELAYELCFESWK